MFLNARWFLEKTTTKETMHVSVMYLLLSALQVSVSLSANDSMPGDQVTLHVRAEKGSCVCVAAVDKSLYLLKPDFQLSPDKVGRIYSL